jgi:hypothetical protein
MNLKEYIDQQITKFNNNYIPSEKRIINYLRDKTVKSEKRQYDAITSSSNWSRINSNDDIVQRLNAVKATIQIHKNMLNNNYNDRLRPIDYFTIYLSFFSFITAMHKVAQCYDDNNNCNFNYTEDDIEKLFNT